MVRAQNMTPDQLAEILKALQGGMFPAPAAVPGVGAVPAATDNTTSESKEEVQNED